MLDLAERSDTPEVSAPADATGAVGEPSEDNAVGAVDESFHVRNDAANEAGESFISRDDMGGVGSFALNKLMVTAHTYRNKLNTLLKAAPEAAEFGLPLSVV